MKLRNIVQGTLRIVLPVILGAMILFWMYRGISWHDLRSASDNLNWWWLAASMPFGILAQWLRAARWRQMLEPIGERTRLRTSTIAIYISYASSLVIPRIGEVLRCGVMKRYDGTDFGKALGTVVTERIIDICMIVLITIFVFVWQWHGIVMFVTETGFGLQPLINRFSGEGWFVTIVCAVFFVCFSLWLSHRLKIWSRIKASVGGLTAGLTSVRVVRNKTLLTIYSAGIWVSYFLHFYIAFFAFDFTASVPLSTAAISFIIGTFAVLVPTPNGAGPWHFAVKTVLMLYGVAADYAAIFALIVHTIQTLFTAVLGLYGLVLLTIIKQYDTKS